MERMKRNYYKIKKVASFDYLGSKIVTNGRVQKEMTEIIKMHEHFIS
jgi:hypothetical protein